MPSGDMNLNVLHVIKSLFTIMMSNPENIFESVNCQLSAILFNPVCITFHTCQHEMHLLGNKLY